MAHEIDTVIGGLTNAAAKAPPNNGLDKAQLKTLAEQFESTMVSQMLKGLQASMFDSEDEGGGSSGIGPLSDALFNELSMTITKSGGLGISKAMMGPLSSQVTATQSPATAGSSAPDLAATAAATRAASGVASLQSLNPTGIALPGRVSSAYGMRKDPISGEGKMHSGTDIPMPYGSDVRTAGAGTVVSVQEAGGYGLQVVVDHGDGVTTRYAHLSESSVKPGDTVAKGQVIAASGNSGRSTGPHLHFEVLSQGRAIDPQSHQAANLLNH